MSLNRINQEVDSFINKLPSQIREKIKDKYDSTKTKKEKSCTEVETILSAENYYKNVKNHLSKFKQKENDIVLEFVDFETEVYLGNKHIAEKIKKGCIGFCEKNQEVIEKINGLIFFSETRGSGKTFMAKIICNYFLNNYKMAKFTTAYNMISEIMQSKENSQDLIYKYKEYSFLVLDELNMIKFTEYKENIFYDIIEYRKQNKKPTIITTNIKPKYLQIDETLKNRLENYFYTFEFPEVSVRDNFKNIYEQELKNILFD